MLTTISDRKKGVARTDSSSLISYYKADVQTAQDYYPFGMLMPGRSGYQTKGGWAQGNQTVNGTSLPELLTLESRENDMPPEYKATREVVFTGEYISGTGDEFLAYIANEENTGTGSGEGNGQGVVSGYRYGFNGQEKSDEIKGEGNSYTAEFWEYDPRIGRRWNLDPKPVEGVSEYSAFQNNPIWFSDVRGDSSEPKKEFVFQRENPDGDQRGFLKNAPEYARRDYPVRAFIKNASHAGLEFFGINAIDNFIADRVDGHNSAGELTLAIVRLAFEGPSRGGKGPKGSPKGPPVKAYEVGLHNELQSRSVVGDNIEIHHVPQAHPSEQIIGGYQRGEGPSIALPKIEHKRIPTERGISNRTPRQQLAKDVRDLRQYTNAPNESLLQLIDFNKQLFGSAFKK